MPSNARKLLGLVLFAVFSLPFTASALTVSTSDSGASVDFNNCTPSTWIFLYDANSDALAVTVGQCGTPLLAVSSPPDIHYEFIENLSLNCFSYPRTVCESDADTVFPLAFAYNNPSNVWEIPLPPLTIDPSIASFSIIGSTSAHEMIAGVGNATKTTGSTLWVIVALGISIPLAFFVFDSVISLLRENEAIELHKNIK
jgi:hypothetical protein